jgi:preprotein translocase subunit SecG
MIQLTIWGIGRYNPFCCLFFRRTDVTLVNYFDIALIITSIALIASVILQNKGVGLGGLTGSDTGGVFAARRGIEKVLFMITIGLSVLFFILTLITVIIQK